MTKAGTQQRAGDAEPHRAVCLPAAVQLYAPKITFERELLGLYGSERPDRVRERGAATKQPPTRVIDPW